jgi:hypothetical protein
MQCKSAEPRYLEPRYLEPDACLAASWRLIRFFDQNVRFLRAITALACGIFS